MNRRALLGAAVATFVVAAVPRGAPGMARTPNRLAVLTPHERKLAILTARSLTNQEIGAPFGIARPTLLNHLQWILLKLDVSTRAAAIGLVQKETSPTRSPA